jgi:hypothetical protein
MTDGGGSSAAIPRLYEAGHSEDEQDQDKEQDERPIVPDAATNSCHVQVLLSGSWHMLCEGITESYLGR